MFTFGLGSGCDKKLVRDVARVGRGTSTIVEDGDKNLNGLVVQALSNAMEPSLQEVSYKWNNLHPTKVGELYRNNQINSTNLIDVAKLDEMQFTLQAKQQKEGE